MLGRLARITIPLPAPGATTDFLYDGDALVGEYVGTGMTRRYVHGGVVDEPLVQYNDGSVGTGYRRYLYADHQGSIIAHSDNAGNSTQTNSYDPYGIPNAANQGRFGYTGQTWIKELGLNYYKARMYAPKLGRFLQTDPIFYADDMNIYAYVGNDPLNRNDPTGLCGEQEDPCPGEYVRNYDREVADYNSYLAGAGSPGAQELASNVPIIQDVQTIVQAGQQAANGNFGSAAVVGAGLLTKKGEAVVKSAKAFYSYVIKFKSGAEYVGKGIGARVKDSIRRLEAKFGDKAKKAEVTPAPNEREAFKAEYKEQQKRGGPRSPRCPYNDRWSPGAKMCTEDQQE